MVLNKPLLSSLLLYTTVGLILVYKFNLVVPDPYMDEIFHVNQTKKYCQSQYSSWDSKITTPPGLYLVLSTIAKGLNFALKSTKIDFCSTGALRYMTFLTSCITFIVVYRILGILYDKKTVGNNGKGKNSAISSSSSGESSDGAGSNNASGEGNEDSESRMELWKSLSTLSIMTFPILYFFGFLVYTDQLSVLLVLLGYLASLEGKYWWSAGWLVISLTVRQNNIIWAAVIVGWAVLSEAQGVEGKEGRAAYEIRTIRDFVDEVKHTMHTVISNVGYLVVRISGYVVVVAVFVGFLAANNFDLVYGDKSNHQLALHFPNVYYFIMAVTGLCFPTFARIVDPIYFFRKNFLRSWRLCLYVCINGLMLLTVKYCTYEHPFILSDNRHFSFYIWKDIYRRNVYNRYLLVPVYFYCGWLCWKTLAKNRPLLPSLLYIVGMSLSLVPSPLFEFRYFVLPYMFLRLHIVRPSKSRVVTEMLWSLVINAVVFYMFLQKPFYWPSSKEKMRFMW